MHNGRCVDATAPTHTIDDLRKAAAAHGVKVESGKCADATDCINHNGVKFCRSGKAGDWGGDESVHFDYAGQCMQFTGPAIKEASIDQYIAKKLGKDHHHLEEGTCKSAGFTDRHYHKLIGYGVWSSVWSH
jgi:hypothetical protein